MSVWWEECIARHAFDGEHNVKFFKLRFLYSFEMANRKRAEQEREGVSGLESDQFIYIAQSAKHYSYGNLLIIISLLRFFFNSVICRLSSVPSSIQNSVLFSAFIVFLLVFLIVWKLNLLILSIEYLTVTLWPIFISTIWPQQSDLLECLKRERKYTDGNNSFRKVHFYSIF